MNLSAENVYFQEIGIYIQQSKKSSSTNII